MTNKRLVCYEQKEKKYITDNLALENREAILKITTIRDWLLRKEKTTVIFLDIKKINRNIAFK